MLKEKNIEKRIFGFGQSLVLSRLKRDLSKTKRRKVVVVVGGHSRIFTRKSFHHRANETATTSPIRSFAPDVVVSLLHGEEKGKRSD
jgi:hypothetical protein